MLAHPLNRVNVVMATGAMVFAIVAFMFAVTGNSTPCAQAQTSQCSIGDDEIISGDLTLQEELVVGATPSSGTSGQILESQGSNLSPEWIDPPSDAPTYVYKSANTQITSDATLDDDPHLTFTAVANTTYAIEGVLLVTESGAASGHWLVMRPSPPSGGADVIAVTDTTSSSITLPANFATETVTADCNAIQGSPAVACYFSGTSIVGGSGGTWAIQWAQNSSQANNLTLELGSWLSYRAIDP